MYISVYWLSYITIILLLLLSIGIVLIAIGINDEEKTKPLTLLYLLPLIGTFILFYKTTDNLPDYNKISERSKEKWHTIYTNNINADIKLTTDQLKLNPKQLMNKNDIDSLFLQGSIIPLHMNEIHMTITATNKTDSTSKNVILTQKNFIEK